MKEAWNKKNYSSGWKPVDDYHVTTYYIGKDQEKTDHKLFQNHVDGVEVEVKILALVIVPNKIITAICFPDYEIANKCPHVTLMTNEWKPF